ncbi:3-oxoacyl-[acyl-carrier-protein] synthase III C-terminal domain-containing protein [Nocardia sp. NPDC046763]|uniref:3-oxoacyl-[acyl-carrier-protein] synthase III C-terminal domain-containing protein n=1 Tax=Nocardia sp. NPDC046763 TaxID=3155256 RepID=UPI0033EDDAE2
MNAYITATGRFLPGDPVPNNEIEDYIGKVGRGSSDLKELILENCGIKTRHYAIDKQQNTVYSNARMAAEAVRAAAARANLGPDDFDLLAAATTMPDLMGPGHASMVHGELGYAPLEIITAHGICSSGMMALKNAYLQVMAGEKKNAVAVASELASRGFKSSRYAEMTPIAEDGSLPMETAFLRYMLSDGAGAAVVQDKPKADGISLRIDWISLTSYANTEKTCMYFGSKTNDCEKTWNDYPNSAAAAADGAAFPRQKLALLPHLVNIGIIEAQRLIDAGRIDLDRLDWFPAHYSSERMKELLIGEMKRADLHIAPEKWFSNLTRVGNIGSASIYIILDEMLNEGMIEAGQQVVCMVPESGRFAISFMHLTAVAGDSDHA